MSSHSLPPARKQHHGSPRHNRLCWVIQKCAEELAYIRRVNASETEPIPLAKRPPMALEIDCCTLTNRVNYDAVCTTSGSFGCCGVVHGFLMVILFVGARRFSQGVR